MKIIQARVGMMEVYCYIVYDESSGDGIVIDPGGDEDKILALLRKNDIKLRYIVNTHGHADHTCGNGPLRAATGAPIVVHAVDDDFFQLPQNQQFAQMMGFALSPPADVRVQDGDELTFGSIVMKFIHTPGHSPGSCCLLIGDNLFTGDTLFVGAVGRTDLPGSSLKQMIDSFEHKIMTLPPSTKVWPGHDYGDKPTSTIRMEAQTNPYIIDFMS